MKNGITLRVYRRLYNRFEGLSDDSPRALELHNRRREALHVVFDADTEIRVMDWGDTDDSRSHEYVDLILGATGITVFHYAIVPGLKWLGLKLAEKGVDTILGELVKKGVSILRPTQEAKKTLDVVFKLPDGTEITVDPPDRNATITINFADGTLHSLEYRNAVD